MLVAAVVCNGEELLPGVYASVRILKGRYMCDCMKHAPAEGTKDWRCPECGMWYVWVYAEMDGYWKPQTLHVDHDSVMASHGDEVIGRVESGALLVHDRLQENGLHPAATGAAIEDSAFVYVQKPDVVSSADADHSDEMAAKAPVMPPGAPEAFGMDELPGSSVKPLVGHYAHPSAIVDAGAVVGIGTKIWHFSHIMAGARIGANCVLGQNVHIAGGVHIGDGVKIQNNVSLYDGCVIEDDVFIGPSAVFTNVKTPRAFVDRHDEYLATRICRGASIGANATVVCGVMIGEYAFVGAGAVVTRDVPDHAMVVGCPARVKGWVCKCGEQIMLATGYKCPHCNRVYEISGNLPLVTIKEIR
jgi:UDP-2-acetamido-3-amino-2,3-dideoxy-glucuronate N-acetyltransferase